MNYSVANQNDSVFFGNRKLVRNVENKKIKHDLNVARHRVRTPFWGTLISIVSILQGEFIVRVDGYLLNHSEPYLSNLPEDIIGWVLITFGAIKLLGLVFKKNQLKKYGIWGLSGIWTGLFLIALTYSFGTGFPHPSWITYMMVTFGCYNVSKRGDFKY